MMLLAPAAGMLYPPPALASPKTIQLDAGPTVSHLDPARDYILKCPPRLKVGATIVIGGRNIVLKGCDLTIPASTPPGDANRRAIYIKGATGTVQIENISITNPSGSQFDGIFLAAPQASVVLQNIRVEGLTGRHREFHSDAVQMTDVRQLRINRMTIIGGYQMLLLFPQAGRPVAENIWLSDINGRFTGHQVWSGEDPARGDNGGTFIWLTRGLTCAPAANAIHLANVYAKVYPKRGPGGVGQPSARAAGCPAVVSADGRSVSWPTLPVQGRVTIGDAPNGDFVPAGSVGFNRR